MDLREEKKVEYLELIYDLIFVYIIGRNNSLLHNVENGFVGGSMFLVYVVCTLAIIQIWNFSTFYINMHGRNGLRDHIALFVNMRYNMFSEVTRRYILHLNKCIPKDRPAENINSHRSFVASWMFRLLLKLLNNPIFIGDNNTESASFLHRHLISCNSYISLRTLVKIQHYFIIHFVNMITRKDEYIIRIVILHILKILINGICGSGVPLTVSTLLVRREYSHTAKISIQIPWHTYPNMLIKSERSVLCQNSNCINTGIYTIAKWKIDDLVFAPKCDRRFSKLRGKNSETTSLSPGKKHCYHFLFDHSVTPLS